MTGNYSLLIEKLDEFIRKYYRNQVIKGSIYATGITIGFFLFISLAEYFAWMGSSLRTVLFYIYVLTVIAVISKLIIIPLFKIEYLLNNNDE